MKNIIKYELKKVLFSYRFVWVILILFTLNVIMLFMLPEIIDERIRLSRSQFDRVLETVHGETSLSSEIYISYHYNFFNDIVLNITLIRDFYIAGEITHDEWVYYVIEYERARIYLNAFSIFNEYQNHFSNLREIGLFGSDYLLSYNNEHFFLNNQYFMTPAFFDNFGFQTVFTYLSIPNPFSIISILILAVLFLYPEIQSGVFSVIKTTKHGGKTLFISKTMAFSIILTTIVTLIIISENLIFLYRFNLSEGYWPIYSLLIHQDTLQSISLWEAMIFLSLFRWIGNVFLGLITWGFLCFFGDVVKSITSTIGLVFLPWILFRTNNLTIVAWLSGDIILRSGEIFVPFMFIFLSIILFLYVSYNIRFSIKITFDYGSNLSG